ncbi:putative PEP-binding protein [Vibrio algarum]|uniref:Phosphoenolpyruvate synthase n=1 Tax=Vibrio algarum TaxID=3020714 RepID=A0ABT4YQX5_9VIBR|nr:putative PEP-binding protein [Vibrio sp. KJ40-1]MDB1123918.1 phosphoenolpyruvate synthase [Vibrio sp. KJ40-1]
MSNATQGVILPEIEVVNALPSYTDQVESDQLYVSLADLIMEKVFYHPSIDEALLSETDKATLQAILNGQTVKEHFVSTLCSAIKASITPSHKTIRICLSNIDSYAFGALLGGQCEDNEVNPKMGLRGVGRYASNLYSSSFALECEVVKQLRSEGLNIELVVPFVRALSDAATIIDKLAEQGLPRGLNGFRLLYSCDVPSSILLAEKLLHYFDGVVINVENLAQFTLGIDNNNEALQQSFDIQSEAVSSLIVQMVKLVNKAKKPYLILCPALASAPILQETLLDLKNMKVAITG